MLLKKNNFMLLKKNNFMLLKKNNFMLLKKNKLTTFSTKYDSVFFKDLYNFHSNRNILIKNIFELKGFDFYFNKKNSKEVFNKYFIITQKSLAN
jgi:hypothetical protein